MHLEQWPKNKTVENSIKAAKPGVKKPEEINEALSLFYSKKSPMPTVTSISTSATTTYYYTARNKQDI